MLLIWTLPLPLSDWPAYHFALERALPEHREIEFQQQLIFQSQVNFQDYEQTNFKAKDQSQCCHDAIQRTERHSEKRPISGPWRPLHRFAAAWPT